MMNFKSVFYAYPSQPPEIGEAIEAALANINNGGVVSAMSWRGLSVTGRVMIDEITKKIDESEILACDLTNLNHNVLFELGYGIGRSKRIWISLYTAFDGATAEYKKLGSTLIPIGYSEYVNRVTLEQAFYRDQPWTSTDEPSYPLPRRNQQRQRSATVLYLKNATETDASLELSERINNSQLFRHVILDDPREVPSQPISWYVENLAQADAVIAHLLGEQYGDRRLHNAKCSLVCGLGKPVLMLADPSFLSPVDYRLLLQIHHNAAQCRTIVDQWLTETYTDIAPRLLQLAALETTGESARSLRRLYVGDMIAENEEDHIDSYFVETSAYQDVLDGREIIFVGRKGTGKSANLYQAAGALRSDRRNTVCVIKPVGYELDGIIRMLTQNIHVAERGYLVESLWKYLIYTELALSVTPSIGERAGKSKEELDLISFVDSHRDLIDQPFSSRLQHAVDDLCTIDGVSGGDHQRARVSEILHDSILKQLRQLLGAVLEKKERVAVLIDNLDQAWGGRGDVDHLVWLILGLLGVSGRIVEEFQASNYWKKKVNLSLAIFLRSDIFARVLEQAREKDKLRFTAITWSDPQLLIRVLESRLAYSFEDLSPQEIWSEFFTPIVDNVPVKDYIINNSLARPRDVIYLIRTAIGRATTRNHVRVEKDDFVDARKAYSSFVLNAIIAEDNPKLGKLEEVLYEFVGSRRILTRKQVETAIEKAGVNGDSVSQYLDLLCDLNFLGIGTDGGSFAFPQEEQERKLKQIAARKLAERRGIDQEAYQVHPAFYPVLEID